MNPVKSMKSKIRSPVLLLIVGFAFITLLLFNVAMRIYVDNNAKNELQSVSKTMETVVKKELTGNLRNYTTNNLKTAFTRLFKALHTSKLAANTEMLLYSRRQELLYPQGETDSFVNQQLVDKIAEQLPSMKEKKVYTIRTGNAKYFFLSYPLTNFTGDHPTIVFVAQAGESNALIRMMNLILICVMLLGAAFAALLANQLSARIAKPVAELCDLTKKIGKGEFSTSSQSASDILELGLLHQSINEMSARLEANDKYQKTFLQNASHELRTPLMSIQGYAEGIQSGVLPDVKHAAEVINSESKRLNTLVEELLTLSRIESQTYVRELTVINLCDVLKEYAQRLGGFVSKLQRQLTLTLSDTPVLVLADDALLSQAVMNIASNCLRYAKTTANISLLQSKTDAVIRITDDGAGIPEADLPHIFERFYKGTGGNFGLGLAIAKSAVEFMNGNVRAYNTKGGAVFEITLPVQSE